MEASNASTFKHLQETLLELKGRNYSLEEQARRQKNALGEAEAKVKVEIIEIIKRCCLKI